MTRSSKAAGRNDRQHRRPRAPGLGSLLIAWPALLGTMLAGCGAAQGYGHLTLTDPYLGGMNAAVITVPAGWKAQGSVGRTTCGFMAGQSGGQPVLGLMEESADGQIQYRQLPTLGWQWANTRYSNPQLRQFMARQAPHQAPGCLPIFAPVSAAQFVRLYAQHLPGVTIIGSSPVPRNLQTAVDEAAAAQRRFAAQSRLPGRKTTLDVAALQVESDAHGERRDGLLTAVVKCNLEAIGPSRSGACLATMRYLVTPPGKLGEMSQVLAGLPPIKWDHHWLAVHNSVQGRQAIGVLNANQRQANTRLHNAAREDQARSNASHRAFMQQQATQRREHDAFLGQMRSSTQRSMNNANAAMNARSTAASDWTDYALDQQTVRGANGTYKTSSQYTNVWSSPNAASPSHRRTFGSTDNNANPNSATDNTWTKDKKVHGNGQPPW